MLKRADLGRNDEISEMDCLGLLVRFVCLCCVDLLPKRSQQNVDTIDFIREGDPWTGSAYSVLCAVAPRARRGGAAEGVDATC